MAARTSVPATTYYIIGDLDGQGKSISDNEILIFEGSVLRGAYHINEDYSVTIDKNLADELNYSITKANPSMPPRDPCLIRTGFVADLNHDGYIELVYACANRIFVTSYNPNEQTGSRFVNWPRPVNLIDADLAETLSVADLDGNGFLDLAAETRRVSNNQSAVSFFLSFSE